MAFIYHTPFRPHKCNLKDFKYSSRACARHLCVPCSSIEQNDLTCHAGECTRFVAPMSFSFLGSILSLPTFLSAERAGCDAVLSTEVIWSHKVLTPKTSLYYYDS